MLIREFANAMLERIGSEEDQRRKDQDNARTKVRTVGRLLIKLNEGKPKEEKKDLSSFITGNGFSKIVDSVKDLSKQVNSPHIALRLGHYLKQLILLKTSKSIEMDDDKMEREAQRFKSLYDAHWNQKVSHIANRRVRLRALNKKKELPLTSDLQNLTAFMCEQQKVMISDSVNSYHDWKHLAEILICRVMLFNKRRISRGGRAYRGRFCHYRGQNDSFDNDLLECMDLSEKALAKR